MPNLTIRSLAYQRVKQNGMTAAEATACLEPFIEGQGSDIDWNSRTNPNLPRQVADRIDRVAVAWCMAHRMTGEVVVEPSAPMIRDGKTLATGEGL